VSESPPEQGPGLVQQAVNFGKAVVKHVADRGRKVSDDVYLARLTICSHCPSLNSKRFSCNQQTCGCRLTSKASWRSESCPLQKWPSPND